jgi:Domain of unknown function (DUF3291)
MSRFELAQLNIGVAKGPMDGPVMADFAANLDRINALADASPGFIWRLQTEEGDATALRPIEGDDKTLINMSLWKDVASLNQFVYRSAHAQVMRRRREWFEAMQEAFMVLWWVPGGHRPGMGEAMQKLEAFRRLGPTREAFSFRQAFPPPDAFIDQTPIGFSDECPAR